jgi:dTDP-4-amino-4,6-dideoxygalactose transaminase
VLCDAPEVFRAALEARGIATARHYPRALPEQPAVVDPAGEWAAAQRLAHAVVTVPIYPELTDAETTRVAAALAAAGQG